MSQIYKNLKSHCRRIAPLHYEKIERHKVPIKYIISGGTAAFIDLASLYVFTDILHIHYVLSSSFAFSIAFFVSFYLQKFWTFRDDGKNLYEQMLIYFFVGLTNLGINAGGMYVLVEHILPEIKVYGFSADYILSQVIMGIFIAAASFVVYRYVIFKKRKKASAVTGGNLRVLIATGIFSPDIGGPATYADALFCELSKLGCEIKIVTYADGKISNFKFLISNQTPNSKSQTNPKSQISIYSVGRNQNIILRYLKYFWRVFKLAKDFDIIYILDLMSAGAPAVLAAKLRGKKVVFRTGGDFLWEKAFQAGWTELPLKNYYEAEKNFQEKFLLSFCRCVLKKIDLIIFSTRLQADIYAKYYNVPQDKIKFIANPIPELNAGERDGKYADSIVFAGRLIKLKNLERLVKVFGELRDKNIKLLICGEGPEKNNLQKLIVDFNLNARVELAGNIDHQELIKIINGCRFLILPSITEISPNLALECVSLKRPILLTSETGLQEEITSNLITFNPLSEDDLKCKIVFLLLPENLSQYEEKLQNMQIAKRSWEDVSREHRDIFEKLLFPCHSQLDWESRINPQEFE